MRTTLLDMESVLLFGSRGQLGISIENELHSDRWLLVRSPPEIRIQDHQSVRDLIRDSRPTWILNAAAMTNVDSAHEKIHEAFSTNALAPGWIARCARDFGSRMIHISSEAVYQGNKESAYREDDTCQPVSVYGASKLAGDLLVEINCPDSYILRTSWLYSDHTGTNFPTRILKQLEESDRDLNVVTDIFGNPTPTKILACAIRMILLARPEPGLYNVCCTEAASKYEWARTIAESVGFDKSRIKPVTAEMYPTAALRPKHVDLDCTKFSSLGLMELPTWRNAWKTISFRR